MAMFVVVQVIGIEADSAQDAVSLVVQAQNHTPLGKAKSSAITVDGPEIAAPTLMEVGKWLAAIYPEVVDGHRKETEAMRIWGKFLCDMNEGVEGP